MTWLTLLGYLCFIIGIIPAILFSVAFVVELIVSILKDPEISWSLFFFILTAIGVVILKYTEAS